MTFALTLRLATPNIFWQYAVDDGTKPHSENHLSRLTDMRKLFAVLCLMLLAAAFTPGCTPVDTAREREFRILQSWDMDLKMFNDDVDDVLMNRRPSKLSRWHTHIGDY